jgi:hypothetical protein
MPLASTNSCSEDVGIHSVVIPELKLGDVERHVFFANFVERADYTTFQDRPKTLNRVCVNGADNVLTLPMTDRGVRILTAKVAIAASVIGAKQADFVRHGLMHKTFERWNIDVINDAGDHVALTLDRTDDDSLARTNTTTPAIGVAVFPMFVVPLAADESFVNFDHTAELLNILDQCSADFVTHEPRGFVGAKAHIAFDLQRAHSLFAGEHKVDDAEPLAERLVCILENGPRDMGEPVAGLRGALVALPRPGAVRQLVRIERPTTRTSHPIGPAALYEVSAASFLIGKHSLKFADGHLMDGLRLLAGHRTISPSGHEREYSIVTDTSQVRDNRPRERGL